MNGRQGGRAQEGEMRHGGREAPTREGPNSLHLPRKHGLCRGHTDVRAKTRETEAREMISGLRLTPIGNLVTSARGRLGSSFSSLP